MRIDKKEKKTVIVHQNKIQGNLKLKSYMLAINFEFDLELILLENRIYVVFA